MSDTVVVSVYVNVRDVLCGVAVTAFSFHVSVQLTLLSPTPQQTYDFMWGETVWGAKVEFNAYFLILGIHFLILEIIF